MNVAPFPLLGGIVIQKQSDENHYSSSTKKLIPFLLQIRDLRLKEIELLFW